MTLPKVKIIATILLIGAGIISVYLIFAASPPVEKFNQANLSQEPEKNNSLNQSSPIKWVENLVSNSFGDNQGVSAAGVAGDDKKTVNLTNAIAESMFDGMQKMLENGDTSKGFDPNDPANKKFLEETVGNLPSTYFDYQVNEKDLKISSDNLKEAKINYLKNIMEITAERFDKPEYQRSADETIKDISDDCFLGGSTINKEKANLYQNLFNDYSNLTVPSEWLDFHGQAINYFKKSSLVYSALSTCKDDPIKGQLAAQVLTQLAGEAGKIQNFLVKKYQEINL